MIRAFKESDLSAIMKIWLDTNIKTHHFISEEYWTNNYDLVKEMLPKAEIYVYEDEITNRIDGFIGLTNSYIAGLFVKDTAQSKGIGKQLLDYANSIKSEMSLSVYQENIGAVHFYKREQFQIQSKSVDDNTNVNELIMTWNK